VSAGFTRAQSSRLHRQLIGLGFEPLGVERKARAIGAEGAAVRRQSFDETCGKHTRDAEMAHQNQKDRGFRRFEKLGEIGLDLIAYEPCRPRRAQSFAGLAQHAAQKIIGLGSTKRLIEARTIRNAPFGCAPDRLENEIGAAQFEKGAVTVIGLCGIGQKLDRAALADESLQGFARLVPIDQEDDARTEIFEESLERRFVLGGETPNDQIEDILIGEALHAFFSQWRPFDAMALEKRAGPRR
jgi:hypothetical protein